jgi:hypothetical protein
MSDSISTQVLAGHWIHSHEEDTPTEMVFRPASYSFPPSRGRQGFELKPDQTYREIGIGPTDKPTTSQGRWQVEQGNKLVVGNLDNPASRRILQIASANANRLVIRK